MDHPVVTVQVALQTFY